MLLVCVLTLLAFWPLFLTLYLGVTAEDANGELASSAGASQRHKHATKQRKQGKRPPLEPVAEPNANAVAKHVAMIVESKTVASNESDADSRAKKPISTGALGAGAAQAIVATEAPKPTTEKSLQVGTAPELAAPQASSADVSSPKVLTSPGKDAAPGEAARQYHKLAKTSPTTVKLCPERGRTLKAQGSFGLVTRIFQNDLPYVGSFIRHYQSLGVTTFYFALTKKSHGANVREYLLDLPFLESTAWQLFKNDRPEPKRFPVGVLGDMVKWVKEDYIVQVDIDEYVALSCSVSGFGELVASEPNVALFRFGWVTVPLDSHDSYIVQPPYRGVEWKGSKYLVRRAAVESIPAGDQKVKLNCPGEEDCQVRMLPKTLVHFFARSFGDGLVKAVGNFHDNGQDSSWRKLRWLARQGRLPPRLRMLAYMAVGSGKSGSVLLDSERLPIVTIDRGQESRLLRSYNISAELAQQSLNAYAEYKANITQEAVWKKIKGEASLASVAKAVSG